MGQFAKDWQQLKTIIAQKDDALERQAAQIIALQKQIAVQPPALDGDDQKAVAELRKTVGDNAPAVDVTATKTATSAVVNSTTPHAPAAAVATFTK